MHLTLFRNTLNTIFDFLGSQLGPVTERIKNRIGAIRLSKSLSYRQSQALCGKIQNLADSLEQACGDVENDFIQTGQELQTIHKKTSDLSAQVVDSVKQISGEKEQNGLLPQLRRMAEISLNELEACQSEIQNKSAHRKMVLDYLKDIFAIFSQIDKIGMLLKIVGVNINIESSRSEKSIELFSVVASETQKLSEKIRRIAEESMEILNTAQKNQQYLYKNISKGAGKINHLGHNALRITQEAVKDIEDLMQSSLYVTQQAGSHSKKINNQVGDLVVAIQFHDSMSQRMDHISKALNDAKGLLLNMSSAEPSQSLKNKESQGFSIIQLQNEQLKEIISDIESVYENSLVSFDTILCEIDDLIGNLSDLKTNNKPKFLRDTVTNDPFNILKGAFEDLANVLSQSQELINPERQAATRVSSTVAQISKVVSDIHSIGFETHIMALNAIIKAAHLGQDGGALEILAQEVKKSSDQSLGILAQTDTILNQITNAANHLQAENAENNAAKDISKTLSGISETYDHFMNNSTIARGEATRIKETIAGLKSKLYFLPQLAETLTDLLVQSDGIVSTYTFGDNGKLNMDHKFMGNILNRYTMDRERKIHRNTFNDVDLRLSLLHKPETDQSLNTASVDTVFLSNEIELNSALQNKSNPSFDNENLIIFDDPPHEVDNNHSEHCEEEFGDNVELF